MTARSGPTSAVIATEENTLVCQLGEKIGEWIEGEETMTAVGDVYELTPEARKVLGYPSGARFVCVEDGDRAGIFKRISRRTGKPSKDRLVFHWGNVVPCTTAETK